MPVPEVEPFNRIFRIPLDEAIKLWQDAGGEAAIKARGLNPLASPAMPKDGLRSQDGLWLVRNCRRIAKSALATTCQIAEEEFTLFHKQTEKSFVSTAYTPSPGSGTILVVTPWLEGMSKLPGDDRLPLPLATQVLPYYARVLRDRHATRGARAVYLRDLPFARNWSTTPDKPEGFVHDTEPLLQFAGSRLHSYIRALGGDPQEILADSQTNSEQI